MLTSYELCWNPSLGSLGSVRLIKDWLGHHHHGPTNNLEGEAGYTCRLGRPIHIDRPGLVPKLIIPTDQRRSKPPQMTGLSLDFRLQQVSAAALARPHGLNRGIGSHGQAKRQALSSCGHIFAERNENEHDAICKD